MIIDKNYTTYQTLENPILVYASANLLACPSLPYYPTRHICKAINRESTGLEKIYILPKYIASTHLEKTS